MIIWIASYPKSGNTYIRSFLSAYYFSSNGEFDFELLKNIKQFPDKYFFDKKMLNIEQAIKSYLPAQKKISENGKVKFLKTHNLLGLYKGHPFTIPEYTLGAIYIVRDPRNLLTSLMKHYSLKEEEALEFMMDNNRDIHDDDKDYSSYAYLGNWGRHYESWSKTNKYRKIIINYEDLKNNKLNIFRDVIIFVNTLLNRTERIDLKKLEKAIETTNFNVLKKKEKDEGFIESVKDIDGNKKTFFNKGFYNNWRKNKNKGSIKIIEQKFKKEMGELGYLK